MVFQWLVRLRKTLMSDYTVVSSEGFVRLLWGDDILLGLVSVLDLIFVLWVYFYLLNSYYFLTSYNHVFFVLSGRPSSRSSSSSTTTTTTSSSSSSSSS